MKQVHIPILRAYDELRFNLGKKTLIDFLKGNPNLTIEKNSLDELNSYACLYKLDVSEIEYVINILLKEEYLELQIIGGQLRVISRTKKGLKEIFERNFEISLEKMEDLKQMEFDLKEDEINEEDKKMFNAFNFFFEEYNDNQKKAILSPKERILCIAGAGSGKTSVLTKRVEFLIKFRSVNPKKILAITFTRKARDEMIHRFDLLGIKDVKIETFNSFCEKILRKKGHLIYDEEFKVISYRDKLHVVRDAMKKFGLSLDSISDEYFNKRQLKEKSLDELFFIFTNDIFAIIDFYKNIFKNIENFEEKEKNSRKKRIAKIIKEICKYVEKELKNRKLRDFSDQILDTIRLFKDFPEEVSNFDHLLVDEFQDINEPQFRLIQLLRAKNIFVVGDPRQAIYGWRGSDIRFILNFSKHFKNSQIIFLKENYRSNSQIVDFFNKEIKALGLSDLKANKEGENSIFLFEQSSESLEKEFVAQAILNSKNPPNEIFVIARTNRILENFAEYFRMRGINYSIKIEDSEREFNLRETEIILSTVHSIKGMEAKEVYLVSANTLSFPNKVADNFVFALVKEDFDYDKYSEELRLFYVALSRAKEKLIITYTGNMSKFITSSMLEIIDMKKKEKSLFEFEKSISSIDVSNDVVLKNQLKNWRSEKVNKTGLPLYMIIPNSAIDEIARFKPQTKNDLLNIKGMGEMKVAKYGDEIMRILWQ